MKSKIVYFALAAILGGVLGAWAVSAWIAQNTGGG